MEQMFSVAITIILTALIASILTGVGWFVARKSGLGDIQLAVRTETDRLVTAQRERIELLETQVEDLTSRVNHLDAESKRDKREISRLRKVIADRMIEDQG